MSQHSPSAIKRIIRIPRDAVISPEEVQHDIGGGGEGDGAEGEGGGAGPHGESLTDLLVNLK